MQLYQALITLDGWTFVAQICNLMIQLVIFKKLLLNPVKKVIAERKAKADSQIADAQKLRTEAEAMKAEYEQNLQNARTEANQIVAAAQKTATARSEELLGEARAQAAALKQKAEADIAQERKKAVNEVKDEIGGMAMEIASKVVEREIREADHKDLMDMLRSALSILIVSIVLQLFYGVFCAAAYNHYSCTRKAVLQYGTVCTNAAFLGNAITEGIFGAEGLMLTSIFLIPQRMAMWSVGVSYFMQGAGAAPTTPEEKRAHRKAVILKTIRHPCIVAVVLGMVLLLTQCPLPTFLGNTIKSVSVCNTGMSMILIGAIIGSSDINLRNLLDRDTVLYCLIRLGIIPLLVLLACHVARVNDFVTIISVILSGMPMGGTTAILAEKYNGDSAFASKCVAVSTALSLITTPLWCLVA